MSAVHTLHTERFTLRPLQRSDAAAMFATMSDPEQCRFLPRAAFESEDELWENFSGTEHKARTWIAEQRSGDRAGDVAARLLAIPGHAAGVIEVGYVTAKHRQREGVARECLEALIAHLFALPIAQTPDEGGARKLTARLDTRNVASARVLEGLGFVREGWLREHSRTHIGLCDVYWYGLLRREWPAR